MPYIDNNDDNDDNKNNYMITVLIAITNMIIITS